MYRPRNNWEMFIAKVMRTTMPYLAFLTYRIDVEKAHDAGKCFATALTAAGMRIQDVYLNKFHKEPHNMNHLYGQYFHPSTMQERVHDVAAYRRLRTIFKGFTVPEWAQNQNRTGWEVDPYSMEVWDKAQKDFLSEMTPMQFMGPDRTDSNLINWFRWEQFGRGFSSRLFYNEEPKPMFHRHGHIDDPDKELYSFKWADQSYTSADKAFGIDTSTPEGREEFKKEYERWCQMCPEIFKKEALVFPHELRTLVSSEPYFRRMWQYYREHTFKVLFNKLHHDGQISDTDAENFRRFVGLQSVPTFNIYIYSKLGKLDHLKDDEGFKSTLKVMEAMGMHLIEFNPGTSMPVEEQFWQSYDIIMQLTEEQMLQQLPHIVVDRNDHDKVEALLEGREREVIAHEETRRLAASI